MTTGISYSHNNEKWRRLFAKFQKEGDNFKKLELAHEMSNMQISSGAFPADWDRMNRTQHKATMDKSMLFFVIKNEYWCIFFKKDTIINYDNTGISWNENDEVDFEILGQIPLR